MREISASQDQRQGTLSLQDTALLYKHNTTWVFLVFNFGRKKVSITCCRSVILICPHQLHLWVALNIQANEGGEGGGRREKQTAFASCPWPTLPDHCHEASKQAAVH